MELSQHAMIDALALASLFLTGAAAGSKDVTDAKILPLKAKLLDTLSIGSNCRNDTESEEYNPWRDIDCIKDRLSTFADTSVGKPGVLRHLMDPAVSQHVVTAMPQRRVAVSKYMGVRERLALARLLIKDVDRHSFKLHCRVESCGSTNDESEHSANGSEKEPVCGFRLVECPIANCPSIFSFKYGTEHDDECGFKLLPCPSGCGADIPRNEMEDHARTKCILRASECPLKW